MSGVNTVGSPPPSTWAQGQTLEDGIANLQTELNQLQTETSTGLVSQDWSGLGAEAGQALDLSSQLDAINGYQETITNLQTETGAVNDALTDIQTSGQNIQQLLSQVGSGTAVPSVLQQSAQQALEEVTSALQTSANGDFVFAGMTANQNPMVASTTVNSAVSSAIATALGSSPANVPAALQSAVAGVFSTTSNWYTGAGQVNATNISANETINAGAGMVGSNAAFSNILQGLYLIANTPLPSSTATSSTTSATTTADYQATMSDAANLVSQGLSQVSTLIAQNGDVQSRLTAAASEQTNTKTFLTTQFNDLTQANLANVATQVSDVQTQLQAVYQITADLKNLSLANYL